jgi:hypothetical protein
MLNQVSYPVFFQAVTLSSGASSLSQDRTETIQLFEFTKNSQQKPDRKLSVKTKLSAS